MKYIIKRFKDIVIGIIFICIFTPIALTFVIVTHAIAPIWEDWENTKKYYKHEIRDAKEMCTDVFSEYILGRDNA